MFMRELEERMEIIASNTRCRVFSVSYWPTYYYPYRLGKVGKVWDGIRKSCYELMVDSAYQDASVENRQILEETIEINADYVFPKDYPGDAERTRQSIEQFLELYQDRDDITAKPIPILQYPYADHYRNYEEFYSQFSHLAIGGLQAYDATEQVAIIKEVRDVVGDHTYLHGFGVGTSLPLIEAMREYSPFLDSIDISTAEKAIRTGNIPDKTMQQRTFSTPYGEKSTSVRGQFAVAILTMVNYLLSDKVNSRTVREIYEDETDLPEIQTAIKQTNIDSRHDIDAPGEMPSSQETTLSSFV